MENNFKEHAEKTCTKHAEDRYKQLSSQYAALKEEQAAKRGALEAYNIQRDRAIQDFRNSLHALKDSSDVIIDDTTRAKVFEVLNAAESIDFSQDSISRFACTLNAVIQELENHIEEQMQ